jgi:hypothetical protein
MTQQLLVLKSAAYVSCVAGDIGKVVTDDAASIGVLYDYNNTTRTWTITANNTIAANSVMAITSGTGAGTANANSDVIAIYCTIAQVKERLLIPTTNTTYNTDIESASAEASRLIDIYLTPYVTVPLTSPTAQIGYIAADFATSIFKRRMMPSETKIIGQLSPEGMTVIEASGWWAIALKKLEEYIKNTYHLVDKSFAWTSCQDPDVVLRALDRRVLGIAEARALLKAMTFDPTSKTEAEIDLIEKQIELIDAQIAKMAQDGLLVEAQTLKLAGVDTDKVSAEIDVLEATLTRMSADLTKITAENAVLTQQVLNLKAVVINLTAVNAKLAAETADIIEKTEQLPKRGTKFKFCDEDEEEEEEEP